MIAVFVRQCLGGASVAAISAAWLLCSPNLASAGCEAVFSRDAGGVSVSCDGAPSSPDAAFATSFQSPVTQNEPTIYDGNGADVLVFTGGQIVRGDAITGNVAPFSPSVSDDAGGAVFGNSYLDERFDTIETLGGDDTLQLGTPLGVPGVEQVTIGAEGGDIDFFLGSGADTFIMSAGTLYGSVFGQGGSEVAGSAAGNSFAVTGGTIDGVVFAGSQNDSVSISGTAVITGRGADPDAIGLEDGDDVFVMTGGTVGAALSGGNGADELRMEGGTIEDFIAGNAGNDTITMLGGVVVGGVQGNEGADQIMMSGGTTGVLTGDEGDDTISFAGAAQAESLQGAAGSDVITVSGGTVTQNLVGGDGADLVEVRGGNIGGGIEAETVRLFGGTVGGDISGLSGNTLVIDDTVAAQALVLRDGVVFSGSNAAGTIANSSLAAGGMAQNFTGFSSLALSNSTLRFEGGTQTVDNLLMTGGSTLFIDGVATLGAQNGGFGGLSVAGSTISMIDGDPTDRIVLGGIVLNDAMIGIDVDQSAGRADLLVANGAASASGNNAVFVNLVGGLEVTETTEIAILTTNGTELGGVFTVEGISGTAASLFEYEVVSGPNGGLVLRATPIGGLLGLFSHLDAAASSAALETSVQALEGVNDAAVERALGLAGGGGAPDDATFGVFASGQFARVGHDGFSVFNGVSAFAGPSFNSDDFSAAISVDFNASKHWGFDTEYGLNLGAFAGFTSTNLSMDGLGGFASGGAAENESGMAGAYALMRRQQNYLLVSATGFWGETSTTNGVLDGAAGEYATEGYAVTASAGHIFALGEKTRFDLRGGVLGASFTGDAYVDSRGVQHGETKISFGALKFEPGIYAEYALENGMIFSPYARADLQMRFGYENTAIAEGRTFEFDDEDFSAALSSGFNLRMNASTTLSGEVRGKASSDSTTLAGKLGLKVAF